MTLRPVASYLTRFDEPTPAAPPPGFGDGFSFVGAGGFGGDAPGAEAEDAPPLFGAEAGEAEEPPAATAEDIEAELRERIEAELKAQFDAALEKEKADIADRIAAERRKWTMEEGARIGSLFHQALEVGVASIRSDLEHILEPFVTREILERLLKDFMMRLRARLADEDAPTLQLSGPPDLLEAISDKLKSEKITTSIVKNDGIDVSARIGSTLVETRMEEWLNRLREESGSE